MTPFLKDIAQRIFNEQWDNLQNVHILVPNRRAILYLKRYFSELSDKPVWTPKMYSIEDFVFEATGLHQSETVDILFELYAIHRMIAEQDARGFDDFVRWGEQLLADFNDIDFYLVDAAQLFSYLSEAKAVERWHIDGSDLTENERKYLDFYRSLHSYYTLLHEKMLMEHKAWQGMAYRILAEKFDHCFRDFAGKPFYIIGFNALTAAEEVIFKNIQKSAPTAIIWDADEYYVNNPQHEAGHFLRHYQKAFPAGFELQQNFKEPKNICITGISKNVGQAIAAGRILSEITGNEEAPDHTAVILNNEDLLLPLLGLVPEKYARFNVTMGYPLKLTQLYNFFLRWISLHTRPATMSSAVQPRYDRRGLLDFLQHPVLHDFVLERFPQQAAQLEKNIKKNFHQAGSFITPQAIAEELFTGLSELFNSLAFMFEWWNNDYKKAVGRMKEMILFLRSLYGQRDDAMNMEILFSLGNTVNRLEEIGEKYAGDISAQNIFYVFNRLLRSAKIPFSGEPIGGLQIMGMLETRLLDYKNIILLSVNEGVVPDESRNASFIPFDIRRQFQLPTKQENNAVASYHFYRLLQRAENIHILYNADNSGGLGGGKEQSRFITQLLQELPRYNPDAVVHTKTEDIAPVISKEHASFIIPKTPFAMKRLNEIAAKGFSPSAINDYARCPVEFYLKRIARIPDPTELADAINPALFGNIIHGTIQVTHQELLHKSLTPADIQPIYSRYKPVLEAQFEAHWPGGNYSTGQHYLTFVSAQDYFEAFLSMEQKEIAAANAAHIPYYILQQESELSHSFVLDTNAGKKNILLKGVIDRVARIGDTFRILDFKTGNVLSSEIQIKDTAIFAAEKSSPKAIQVLLYAWLIHKNGIVPSSCSLEAGLFSFRRLSDGFLPLTVEGNTAVTPEILALAEDILSGMMQEIFDPAIPFIPSEEPKAHLFSQFQLLYR